MWLKSIFQKNTASEQSGETQGVTTSAISQATVVQNKQRPQISTATPSFSPSRLELQPANRSANNQIQYDEKLIPQLKSDHASLLALYSTVANMISSGKWEAIPSALNTMRVTMYGHLLTEGVKLYSYMRRNLADDPVLFEVYRSYKKEMEGIGHVVFKFFDKYQGNAWLASAEERAAFQSEFEGLGGALVDRITREENILYPLYSPAAL